MFDIIQDISGRRGIGDEMDQIDSDIKDDMIDNWITFIND